MKKLQQRVRNPSVLSWRRMRRREMRFGIRSILDHLFIWTMLSRNDQVNNNSQKLYCLPSTIFQDESSRKCYPKLLEGSCSKLHRFLKRSSNIQTRFKTRNPLFQRIWIHLDAVGSGKRGWTLFDWQGWNLVKDAGWKWGYLEISLQCSRLYTTVVSAVAELFFNFIQSLS